MNIADYLPTLSIDSVLICFHNEELEVLLLRWKNSDFWSLPGGFIKKNEDVDQAARRILLERTGLKHLFLEQFQLFGKANRRDEKQLDELLKTINFPEDVTSWLEKPFYTLGFLALVRREEINACTDQFTDQCQWFPIQSLPSMIFDHPDIIAEAKKQLRRQVNYLPLGKSLLPDTFTMKSLQLLYEVLLNKKFDRANFHKKIHKLQVLIKTGTLSTGQSNKSPYLYRFDDKRYEQLMEEGIGYV